MSTRGNIIISHKDWDFKKELSVVEVDKIADDGAVVYNHYDSYPDGLGNLLEKYCENFITTNNVYNYDIGSIRLNIAFWIMYHHEINVVNNPKIFSNHGVYLEDFISSDIEYLYIFDLGKNKLLSYKVTYDNNFNIDSYKFLDFVEF